MITLPTSFFDLSKLVIRSPEWLSNDVALFDIRWDQDDWLFQTPRLLFYGPPTAYHKLNIGLSPFDPWIAKVKEIESAIVQQCPKLWKQLGYSPKNKKFVSSFQTNPEKTKVYMNTKLLTEKADDHIQIVSSVYDELKVKQSFDWIQRGSSGYAILCLQSIWRKGLKMGLNWVMLQCKVYKPLSDWPTCVIKDNDDDHPVNHYWAHPSLMEIIPVPVPPPMSNPLVITEQHPVFGKFAKMKRMGIPDGAIESKCRMENVDYEEFKRMLHSSDPPAVQSKPLMLGGPMKLSASMLTSVKLKAAAPVINKPVIRIESNGFRPPSTDDLQSIISRLKKYDPK